MTYAGTVPVLASSGPPRVRVVTLPEGDPGAVKTMREMGRLARAALLDPVVLETAAGVVRRLDPASPLLAQWKAIRAWLAAHWRFLRDPEGVELLRTPRYLVDRILANGTVQGDCDDAATLGAAIGLATGLPARFVAVAFPGKMDLVHVYAELKTSLGWRDLDVTRPAQLVPGLEPTRAVVVEA